MTDWMPWKAPCGTGRTSWLSTSKKSVKRQREKDYLAMMADPLMKRRNDPPKRGSLFNKYAR